MSTKMIPIYLFFRNITNKNLIQNLKLDNIALRQIKNLETNMITEQFMSK